MISEIRYVVTKIDIMVLNKWHRHSNRNLWQYPTHHIMWDYPSCKTRPHCMPGVFSREQRGSLIQRDIWGLWKRSGNFEDPTVILHRLNYFTRFFMEYFTIKRKLWHVIKGSILYVLYLQVCYCFLSCMMIIIFSQVLCFIAKRKFVL